MDIDVYMGYSELGGQRPFSRNVGNFGHMGKNKDTLKKSSSSNVDIFGHMGKNRETLKSHLHRMQNVLLVEMLIISVL